MCLAKNASDDIQFNVVYTFDSLDTVNHTMGKVQSNLFTDEETEIRMGSASP